MKGMQKNFLKFGKNNELKQFIMKCIKLNDHFYVVDDSKIKEGGWMLSAMKTVCKAGNSTAVNCMGVHGEKCFKITHSSQKLEGVEYIPKSEFEKAINGYSVLELACEEAGTTLENWDKFHSKDSISVAYKDVTNFTSGFNKALGLNKDKVFTVEQVFSFLNDEDNYTEGELGNSCIDVNHLKRYFESLLPKTEWEVEIIDGKVKLV